MDRFIIRKKRKPETEIDDASSKTSTSISKTIELPSSSKEKKTSSSAEVGDGSSSSSSPCLTLNESPSISREQNIEETEEDDEADEDEKETETVKRNRIFRQEWKTTFPWATMKNNKCFCKACDKPLVNHSSHLKLHQKTDSHIRNLAKKKNQVQIESFMNQENLKFQDQVRLAELTLVFFLISHNLPFLLMNYLPNLLRECCPDSKIGKAIHCGRTKATELAEVLGNRAMKKIVLDLQTTKFSLIVDETTDLSTKKSLVLVVRYVDKVSKCIHDRFLGLIEMFKTDADTIYKCIKQFFHDNNIPLNNLIGLATDGASVMAGELNGVQAKLKQDVDFFYLKCTCHSLHLCSSYACKKLPLEIETLCRSIYKFFAHSPKRIHEFREFQDYCNVKPHKILGISLTRWLALENVINRIVEQWDALKLYFISSFLDINGIKTNELANLMDRADTKTYFYFLSYILKIINNLNKEFQSEKVRLPYLYENLETNVKLVLSNFINNNHVRHSSIQEIDYKDPNNYLLTEDIFIGSKAEDYLTKCEMIKSKKFAIKNNILNFYIELLDQILLRFDFNNSNMKNLSIITPQKVLSDNEVSILPLISAFPYLVECDSENIATQWKLLRFSKTNITATMEISEFWEKVGSIQNGMNEHCFHDLSQFAFNLLSLPHSSAAAERKFCDFSLIKTKLRNKLGFNVVNSIMLAKELAVEDKNDAHYVWSAKHHFKCR